MKRKLLNAITIQDINQSEAEIYIHGNIIDDSYDKYFWSDDEKSGYVLPIDVRKQLENVKDKDLTIYINSDGGMVSAGIAIANMISRHKGHTTAIIDGWAASIASVIFMAADTRKMPGNTWLMIHKPMIQMTGNADDLQRGVSFLDTIQAGIEETYMSRAKEGVTPEQVHDMVNAETWMTAQEAAEIFDIEVTEEQMEAAACAGAISNVFKHVPENLLNSPIFRKEGAPQPQKDTAKQRAFILKALADSK